MDPAPEWALVGPEWAGYPWPESSLMHVSSFESIFDSLLLFLFFVFHSIARAWCVADRMVSVVSWPLRVFFVNLNPVYESRVWRFEPGWGGRVAPSEEILPKGDTTGRGDPSDRSWRCDQTKDHLFPFFFARKMHLDTWIFHQACPRLF